MSIETRAIPLQIAHVQGGAELESARMLFLEYAQSLDFSLCFQQFDQELSDLPGAYDAPAGRLLLASIDGWPVGCIALRPFDPAAAEVKRLFVSPPYRGLGVGRALVECAIHIAAAIGYKRLLLDTTERMHAARALYASLGFRPTPPYNAAPLPDVLYMERLLT